MSWTRLNWWVTNCSTKIGIIGSRRDQLKISCIAVIESILQILPHYLLEEFILGVVVREPVVDLYGMHHEYVANYGNDQLGVPVGVTIHKIQI